MRLIVVSGLSGAGKSICLHMLEDLGFYCIDNLPVPLLDDFADSMLAQAERVYEQAAVSVDARNHPLELEYFAAALTALKARALSCELLFLTAQDDALIQRFSETRRRHPLSRDHLPLAEAIARERLLLAPLAVHADLIIDTTHMQVHQLRDMIYQRVARPAERGLSLLFQSFGYKHGLPADADFVFDLRCLPNPHWVGHLRPLTGLHPEVADYLARETRVQGMLQGLIGFMEQWIPCFCAENRSYLTVALGCTGGQHRSVFLAEALAAHFRSGPYQVLTRHRELLRRQETA